MATTLKIRHSIIVILLILNFDEYSSREMEGYCSKPTLDKEKVADDLFKRFWNWRMQNSPEFATSVGVHDYDSRLDEMSLGSYMRRKDEAEVFLKEINGFLTDSCDTTGVNFNLKLLAADIEQYLSGFKFNSYLWPLSNLEGPQLDFPRLLSWMKKENTDDFRRILSRLRLFPQQIEETIYLLKNGIQLGVTLHNVSIASVPDQLSKLVSAGEDSNLFKPFNERPVNIKEESWTAIKREAEDIINNLVIPAYRNLAVFLRNEYIPNTRPNIGSASLPNGPDFYAACLKFHTTTDLTPKEVHDIGLKEVERISGRMLNIKDQVEFDGTLKEFRNYLRTDKKFKFVSASEILSHYNTIAKKIYAILPQYFSRLPKADFQIVPVPEEVAASFPGAYYLAPSPDGSRPGTFYINTHKPETRNKYEALCLTLHEAQPGHHTQTALTMESGSLPDFRRFMEDRKYYEPPGRFAMNTGYIEGWGLYSEYLGEEMGLYSDPIDLFGRLSHEMLRACRLVVDTGMHSLGWSRDKAIEFMLENTAADRHDISSEIDRYITWPGQACGYKIGEIKIKELRKRAEKTLGEKFNVKSFHDLIASLGGVPLNILEKQVGEFLEKDSH